MRPSIPATPPADPPARSSTRTASFVASAYSAGRRAKKPQAASAARSRHGRRRRSTYFSRSLRSKPEIGMPTGQTLSHSPQSVAACGKSSALASPT